MTQEIEGTQGMNPEISTEYEPMRPDDPHQPEGSEPIVDIDEETDAELAEAAAATKEALAKPVEERLGLTEVPEPMPYDSYLVHDPSVEEFVGRAQKAQQAVNEMGYGEVQVIAPHTIYLALQGIDSEGYTQVIGARTTADAARVLVTEHAGALADQLKPWRQYGSGTLLARLGEGNEYYCVMALPVTA